MTLPSVDTLRLSPLAFPRNPYHRLVKHYRDGGLKRGQLNDPELDARLALDVFVDQMDALKQAPPDLLAAWHRLCTPEPQGADRALDGLFEELRGAARPSGGEARNAVIARLQDNACRIGRAQGPGRPGICGAGRSPTRWPGCRLQAVTPSCRRG